MTSRAMTLLAVAVALSSCASSGPPPVAGDAFLIRNVTLIDGTGGPARPGALRVDAGRIAAVGALEPRRGERVVDGGGQVLAPGFIDTHSHADRRLAEQPEALAAVSQGVTTVVVGQDGDSPYPLADFFAGLGRRPAAVNVAAYVGHGTLRDLVLGKDFRRHATPAEVTAMGALLEQELASGALGLSTGLEYDPGIDSDPSEVLALARVAARHGGRYISHIRSEDRWFETAVDEVVEIGRQTGMPVQISHLKLAMHRLWGQAPQVLAKLDAARRDGVDVTADVYPYEFWQADMMVLLPDRDPTDRAAVELALAEIAPPDGMWLTRFVPDPSLVGQTLAAIAAARGQDAATTFQQLVTASVAAGDDADAIIATSMDQRDVAALLAWPHSNICSDGGLVDLHPRARGAFAKVLGRYARERGLFTLTEAVHKMTGLAADHLGFADRGRLVPGAAADLVLFDPERVVDRSTPEHPEALAAGVTTVWVNGLVVFADGKATVERPGQVWWRAGAGR